MHIQTESNKTNMEDSIKNRSTLAQYLAQATQGLSYGDALAIVLLGIADCTKKIAKLVAKGALADVTVKLESTNVQGETQMQLDILSNDLFIASLEKSGLVAGIVSEEMNAPVALANPSEQAQFLVNFDPLDGSSNVAVNVSVGSIFSVLPTPINHAINDSLTSHACYLQAGVAQLAAGYALYGPSTMLVITIGKGTHGFTLDNEKQEFILTHPAITIPETTSEFSINTSNQRFWESPVQTYVAQCNEGMNGVRERDFNMRWVASMVADVHRILMRGGVYLYPKDNKLPIKAGRLRLLYEASPMSFIMEQAGGKSSTGRVRIMNVKPEDIHQRLAVIMGSRLEVCLIELYHREFDTSQNYGPKTGVDCFTLCDQQHKDTLIT